MPLHILGQDSYDRIYVMGRNNKVTTMKVKGTHKDIFLKALSKGLFAKFNGKFRKKNTIIIDDNLVKHILNDSENVLFPMSWSSDGVGQNDTFLMDKLLPLHRFEDVRVAVRVLDKIGQPMLCDDPSNREYYVEIKQAIDSAHMLSYS